MTTLRKLLTTTCVAAAALASTFTIGMGSASADEAKKYKIFLSLSYSGNAWQSEAANIVKALAQTPPYDKEVELKEVISGTDPQAQIAAYDDLRRRRRARIRVRACDKFGVGRRSEKTQDLLEPKLQRQRLAVRGRQYREGSRADASLR